MPISKRGIGVRWDTDRDVAWRLSLQEHTVHILADLGLTATKILRNEGDIMLNLQTLVANTISSTPSATSATSASEENPHSLSAIAHSIVDCADKSVEVDFKMGINLIKFILKLELLQESNKMSNIDVMRQEVERTGRFTITQGKRWRDWGSRLLAFVEAGM
jgi:hypothetical protein